jgi:hypothetical protein
VRVAARFASVSAALAIVQLAASRMASALHAPGEYPRPPAQLCVWSHRGCVADSMGHRVCAPLANHFFQKHRFVPARSQHAGRWSLSVLGSTMDPTDTLGHVATGTGSARSDYLQSVRRAADTRWWLRTGGGVVLGWSCLGVELSLHTRGASAEGQRAR